MKKYLSIVLGIILTACLVACSNSSKDLVDEQDKEVISNQEVSDTEEQDTSAELGQTDLDADADIFDISEATVYMFCTSGGSGVENSISDLQKLYPDVNIVDGKRLNDATESDIREWIKNM